MMSWRSKVEEHAGELALAWALGEEHAYEDVIAIRTDHCG